MDRPEKNFEIRVKAYLRKMGAFFYKTWGNAFEPSGLPDIIGVYDGRFFGLELKAEKGRPSKLQLHTIESIRRAGGYARLLYPKDFEEFKKEFPRIGEKDGRTYRCSCDVREAEEGSRKESQAREGQD